MTKSPEDVDPEKAPGIAAMQAIKFEEDDPIGWFICSYHQMVCWININEAKV